MSHHHVRSIDHTVQTTKRWLADLAELIGTDDREFAQRVLRTWLHVVRDGLTVDGTAHFAAQLPDLLRGVYYNGWDPSAVPVRRDRHQFVEHFARTGRIAISDVPGLASTVTRFLCQELSEQSVVHALDRLPRDVRGVLLPSAPARRPDAAT
ncbi:Uncharacterized conserved protein, DUF2267 family [Sinosporangium album]|uniref:Uncharacterized conserved protein, DUF2267 family n=1 Tax=Sinosporangium album TaxID=504805 RepID=A0A1G8BCJ7_9ACTN|nr:DUF2267 domain-containing protein [Sinosporangium album]SDH30946.1 Uncharacterized conserved protein, DUF2267 family [Sinosporangium album]